MKRVVRWPVRALAVAATLGFCTETLAQGNGPVVPGGNPRHLVGTDLLPAPPSPGVPAVDRYFVSRGLEGETSLADEVAALRAELQKIQDEQAAAKRAAADKPSVKVGGRVHFDSAVFGQNTASINQAGDFLNGSEFRRARLCATGDAFYVVDYKIDVDFAGQTAFKDVYITVKELPWLGHVRVGHFKEPFSLEELTSPNLITFMEHGLNRVFTPSRNTGVMIFDCSESENMTWAIGAFSSLTDDDPPVVPYGDYDDAGGTALTMRSTWLPWYDEATRGRGLLHTGICYSYRDVPELVPGATDRFRLRTQPESHLAEYVANTDYMDDADSVHAVDAELAWVYGPFSVQSEYTWYQVDRGANDNPTFHGGYVYLSWFLTGENRAYKRSTGVFDRVKPFENFFRVRTQDNCVVMGKGAWELAYRCSYLNLTDAGVRGGEVTDHTLGLNWYLNPYTRLMLNYVHSDTVNTALGAGTGSADIVQTRFQIDF